MPLLTPRQLFDRLAKAKPVPAILLLGRDGYLREVCRKKLVETFVPAGARDWGIRKFSAEDDDLSQVLGQARMQPMLTPMQLIFLSDVEAWERLGDDSRESLVKQLEEYLENPAPFSILVVEAISLDQRMRLAKVLVEKTVPVSIELSEDPAERARLAVPLALDMAREMGAEIEEDAAEELCDLLNGDLTAIRTELEKLTTYAGERKRITSSDVNLLVISAKTYEVWDLADMLAARRPERALVFLDSLLREGEPPAQVLGALAWMYRKLLEAQELPPGTQAWQAAGVLRMRRDAAETAVRQARKFPKSQLTSGLAALYEADSRLKSGGTSQRAVMEFLVTQLASPDARLQ